MYKHILVPTDGSALSLKSAKQAAALAKKLNAKMTALYVIAPYMPTLDTEGALIVSHGIEEKTYRKATETHAGAATRKVAAAAAAAHVECEQVHVTDPQAGDGIIRAAKKRKCDLIVMASHGRRGISAFLFGSETTKVLTHSKTPVLVCR